MASQIRFSIRHSKSQAAMEFLMTYGWAILVVLAAIGALAYFGVLNPANFVPESCTLTPTSGLACIDFNVEPTAAHLYLVNGGGRDMTITALSVGACMSTFSQPLADGAKFLFSVTGCDFGEAGVKTKQDILISYTTQLSSFNKTASGTMTAKIG